MEEFPGGLSVRGRGESRPAFFILLRKKEENVGEVAKREGGKKKIRSFFLNYTEALPSPSPSRKEKAGTASSTLGKKSLTYSGKRRTLRSRQQGGDFPRED